MAMKEYFMFPKAPELLKPHHEMVLCHISRTLVGEARGSYLSAEMQLVYSAAPADWAKIYEQLYQIFNYYLQQIHTSLFFLNSRS